MINKDICPPDHDVVPYEFAKEGNPPIAPKIGFDDGPDVNEGTYPFAPKWGRTGTGSQLEEICPQ